MNKGDAGLYKGIEALVGHIVRDALLGKPTQHSLLGEKIFKLVIDRRVGAGGEPGYGLGGHFL